jgi:hypothetical protein
VLDEGVEERELRNARALADIPDRRFGAGGLRLCALCALCETIAPVDFPTKG